MTSWTIRREIRVTIPESAILPVQDGYIRALESRVKALERVCNELESEIGALQARLNAVEGEEHYFRS